MYKEIAVYIYTLIFIYPCDSCYGWVQWYLKVKNYCTRTTIK